MGTRKVADIFTFLGAIIQIVSALIGTIFGCFSYQESANEPAIWALMIIPAFYMILNIVLLCGRQSSLDRCSNIVGWGVVTLIFISVIGGVLTLCIPKTYKEELIQEYEKQLSEGDITKEEYDNKINAILNNDLQNAEEEKVSDSLIDEERKVSIIERYKKLLDDGAITKDEFDKKKDEILK